MWDSRGGYGHSRPIGRRGEEGDIRKIAAVGAGTAAYCHALPKCPGAGRRLPELSSGDAAPEISKDEGH